MEGKVEKIYGLAIYPRTQQDRLVWVGNKNGLFLVRNAYHLAKELESRDNGGCFSKDMLTTLWN
jgi:hypothetical protein